jgi:GNAT superfamily N-acetyltransferase
MNTFYKEILNDSQVVSYIRAKEYFDQDISLEKGLLVLDLFTIEEHRGKGYATILLRDLINTLKNTYKYIILDDCSESVPPHNIYYKLGFFIKNFENNDWVKWEISDEPDEKRLLFL